VIWPRFAFSQVRALLRGGVHLFARYQDQPAGEAYRPRGAAGRQTVAGRRSASAAACVPLRPPGSRGPPATSSASRLPVAGPPGRLPPPGTQKAPALSALLWRSQQRREDGGSQEPEKTMSESMPAVSLRHSEQEPRGHLRRHAEEMRNARETGSRALRCCLSKTTRNRLTASSHISSQGDLTTRTE